MEGLRSLRSLLARAGAVDTGAGLWAHCCSRSMLRRAEGTDDSLGTMTTIYMTVARLVTS